MRNIFITVTLFLNMQRKYRGTERITCAFNGNQCVSDHTSRRLFAQLTPGSPCGATCAHTHADALTTVVHDLMSNVWPIQKLNAFKIRGVRGRGHCGEVTAINLRSHGLTNTNILAEEEMFVPSSKTSIIRSSSLDRLARKSQSLFTLSPSVENSSLASQQKVQTLATTPTFQ